MIDTIVAAAVEVAANDDRREISAARPSRSVGAVRQASTVPSRWRAFAQCVLSRESGATLDRPQSGVGAQNPSSSASGRWQMLDASGWRDGGAWNVHKRLVRFGVPKSQAREVRVYLSRTPIHRWHGIWQDTAAIEALEDGGWRHWYLAGSRCNGLVPR
jgi:hypothetical protein